MLRSITVAAFVLSALAFSQASADDVAARAEAADRYLEISPVEEMMHSSATEIAKGLPEAQRQPFIDLLTKEYDYEALKAGIRKALIETFTAEELNAFNEFYGSEIGQSVLAKFGIYMAAVTPMIQRESMRAVERLQAADHGDTHD